MKIDEKSQVEIPTEMLLAILNQEKVVEPPHNFYAYPARFSPGFARAAVRAFTKKGDTVLDPFCGGGTSLVEAIQEGRRAAGSDISALATFLSRAKTSPLSVHDKRSLVRWIDELGGRDTTNIIHSAPFVHDDETGYQRNLPGNARSFFGEILRRIHFLKNDRQKEFARLILLAVGQRTLDCKMRTPSPTELKAQFLKLAPTMISQHYDFVGRVASSNEIARCRITNMRRVINKPSEYIDSDGRIPRDWLPVKLVLTSPPYPGVHVVYHRWQVKGRKETPAPFWLTNCEDGAGETHYTLGGRKETGLKTYFSQLGKTFKAVRNLLAGDSIVIQLVAFSEPRWQLPRYLATMEKAGYAELLPICSGEYLRDRRIWRNVPGRRWYTKHTPPSGSSSEVLLLHRIRAS
jgi:hypothetical protein